MKNIQVTPGGAGFAEQGTGRAYTPLGCNYFDPLTGWAPHIWQQFDAGRVKRHFAQMEELGVNTVRVFLTAASFMDESGELPEEGMVKADRMLAIAREHGIRVEFTGPDLWEGVPDWASAYFDGEANAFFLHDEWMDRLQRFWRQFAAHYRGEPALFSFDLLNEPWLKWDSPLLRKHWGGEPPAMEENAAADGSAHERYQLLREQLVETWTAAMTGAIRESDPQRLITIGFHQLSLPHGAGQRHTLPGFHAAKLAHLLDYIALHWYPYSSTEHVQPRKDGDPVERNIAMIRSSLSNARAGKPLVIEEFGWYGGGEVFSWGEQLPFVTEEVQTEWLRMVVEGTQDLACGWLTWGYADVPTAMDATRRSGLVDEAGKIKLWGSMFRRLSERIRSQ
ncbi:cellulase family glycosylhydrolase [Paenibacillus nasutitermitis]|uniref:mannan endo-1,4-beta-mannosidase n=1 Tax=Paenibacillus nasutitermitis TaxID=1652958 RepID=A0A917E0S3_9BACL|nr:cellulase family glycosylhydrolase [Paenibacillus nasutitermitis]GGD89017.1 hypothetical protein GCM10010911_54510 [Paenibacillus nasutitermitis]